MSQSERQLILEQEFTKLFEKEGQNDLRWLLDQPQGQRFLWWLIGYTGYFGVTFKGNQQDAVTAGKRMIGEELFYRCSLANPKSHAQMLDTHQKLVVEINERAKKELNNGPT